MTTVTKEFRPPKQYELICRGTICANEMTIVIKEKTYHYDVIAEIMAEGEADIFLSVNLRPTLTGCNPHCQEPTLNSVFTSLPWTKQAHTIIPVKQYGDFYPNDPADITDDPIYRADIDPTLHLYFSLEFE